MARRDKKRLQFEEHFKAGVSGKQKLTKIVRTDDQREPRYLK